MAADLPFFLQILLHILARKTLSNEYKDYFLSASHDWVCNPYVIDIRYVVRKGTNDTRLLAASISLVPFPLPQDMSFKVETEEILAGQEQRSGTKKELLEILQSAAEGRVKADSHEFLLSSDTSYMYSADLVGDNRWFDQLNLRVTGASPQAQSNPSYLLTRVTDNGLRRGSPPFDGLADLMAWLGLENPEIRHSQPTIDLRVFPPIDITSDVSLSNNCLRLTMYSHTKFDRSTFSLATRTLPADGVKSRTHVTSQITWNTIDVNKLEGKVEVQFENSDNVQIMLMIGESTVRRQWIMDPARAENNRLVAMQLFDKNLRMVREAFESSDSIRFEMAVGAVLFLMGFSSAVQLEKDAPDLVVSTPSGRIVLVECATKIADFHTKLGKLVGRKANLTAAMQGSKVPPRVEGLLVCAAPRDQIHADMKELRNHHIPIVTKEDLYAALDRLRFHVDPDAVLDEAIANLDRPDWLRV